MRGGLPAGSTIAHVYWRSHVPDTNGDGVGDCRGLIETLPIFVYMGYDAIWLAPFFESPQKDAGYDVSDFFAPDPSFGSMDDVDELIDSATQRGVRLFGDFILGHTSDQHPDFVNAIDADLPESVRETFQDRYIFVDGDEDEPPTNAVSVFNGDPDPQGSAWTYVPSIGKWYYHTYMVEQPNRNFRNPDVVQVAEEGIRFWLAKGFAGFRLDALPHLFVTKDVATRESQLVDPTNRVSSARYENPHRNVRDESGRILAAKAVGELVARVRVDHPDAYFVGEVTSSSEIVAEYRAEGYDCLDMALPWIKRDIEWIAAQYAERTKDDAGRSVTWNANHDFDDIAMWSADWIRNPMRPDPSGLRCLATLLLLAPSIAPCIVYSGMPLGDGWGVDAGLDDTPWRRDCLRAPTRWISGIDAGGRVGGFTSGTPWLSMTPDDGWNNVASQLDDPYSTLRYFRTLIELRKELGSQLDEYRRIPTQEDVLAYDVGDVRVIVNLGHQSVCLDENLLADREIILVVGGGDGAGNDTADGGSSGLEPMHGLVTARRIPREDV